MEPILVMLLLLMLCGSWVCGACLGFVVGVVVYLTYAVTKLKSGKHLEIDADEHLHWV